MNLRKSLFWDTKSEHIDYENDAYYVIERVLERGNHEEWQAIKSYYGLEKIKNISLNIRYLSKKTLNFCSFYFNEPIENFRCWQVQMQLPESLRWEF